MARKSASETIGAIEKSQAVAQSGVVHEFLDQADSLLNRLIASHRSGKLTDRDASVGVAVISELRMAADKANHAIFKGIEAGESLTGTAP